MSGIDTPIASIAVQICVSPVYKISKTKCGQPTRQPLAAAINAPHRIYRLRNNFIDQSQNRFSPLIGPEHEQKPPAITKTHWSRATLTGGGEYYTTITPSFPWSRTKGDDATM